MWFGPNGFAPVVYGLLVLDAEEHKGSLCCSFAAGDADSPPHLPHGGVGIQVRGATSTTSPWSSFMVTYAHAQMTPISPAGPD